MPRKKTVNLEWEYFPDFQEALHAGFDEDFGLYAIFLRRTGIKQFLKPELVYIGSTMKTVSERLLQSHEGLISALRDLGEEHYIEFAFGAFTKPIDEALLRDVESALIADFKPRLNGVGVKSYKGQPLTIESECEDEKQLNFSLTYE